MADFEGWVSSPNQRGTMSIIHGCLTTIVICTWSALHLNVPADKDSWTKCMLRQLLWMGLAILAPELVPIQSMRERYETNWLHAQFLDILEPKQRCVEKGHPSVSSTSSLANKADPKSVERTPACKAIEEPGASETIETICPTKDVEDTVPSLKTEETVPVGKVENTTASSELESHGAHDDAKAPWTLLHTQYAHMGGFNDVSLERKPYRLNGLELLALLQMGKISRPKIEEADIEDKNKADALAKTIACVQILWLVIYLISRVAQQLPVTTFELFALAIVFCTFFNYWGWWHKPKDIYRATDIPTNMPLEELKQLLKGEDGMDGYHERGVRVTNTDNIGAKRTGMKLYKIIYALPALAFGTCHMLAWNMHFPTIVEQTLWRAASVGCFVIPFVLFLFGDLARRYQLRYDNGLALAGILYGVLRLYLFVEMFAGLRDVPAAVYDDVNWLQFWPHFGN